jgi:hypothetical protein
MQTITITVADDGQISVDTQEDGKPQGEPYQCKSMDECLKFVQSVMSEESGEPSGEAEAPEDYSRMWSEESNKRTAMSNSQSMF